MSTDPKNALVHVDITGKAANTLVNKIGRFVWGIFGPKQIRRFAKAEADAARIAAESEIEVTDLQRRAAQRRAFEDAAHQEHMEAIVGKAVPMLEAGSDADTVDDDWFANYFEKARNVSNEEMQSLWARVLAGEVNSPGTFSRRAVNAIADLDKRDCEMFTRLCSFAWNIGDADTPIILNRLDTIYTGNEITFSLLSHLETIGLIRYSDEATFHLEPDVLDFDISYFGEKWHVKLWGDDDDSINKSLPRQFTVGHVLLTQLGHELIGIAGAQPIKGFVEYAVHEWRETGQVLTPTLSKDSEG